MWSKILILLVVSALSTEAVDVAHVGKNFRSGVQDYFKYGGITDGFQKFMNTINLTHAFRNNAETYIDSSLICEACDSILDELLNEIRNNGLTQEALKSLVIDLCTSLVYESHDVCEGAISFNIGILWYIIHARPEMRSDKICGIVAQSFGCSGTPGDWSIDIPEGTSDINKGVVSDSEPLKLLHLTDIHYDNIYEPGSLANCGEPLCCGADSGVPAVPEDGAGYWGDYRSCDTPLYSVDDALEHVTSEHPDIDYVYYTGDVISHRVWATSKDMNTADLKLFYQRLADAFPHTPVYPVLGNHESHPLNIFAPLEIDDESLSTRWLYDLVAEIWSQWLGDDAAETIRRGGFYTVLVKPGFRIIALNSNVAYTFNWWLLYDDVDPYGQLQWFANTLYEAEQNGEKVHILSHVPSSDSTCYSIWSREYRRIFDRFAGTISATFNGHTHDDELIVYHSIEKPNEAIGVAWNGGSLTTYSDKNPNYKLYEVDSESHEVLDYDVWTYNITAVNLTPDVNPRWYKLYSFKDAYGLDGAAPSNIRELAIKIIADHTVAERYFRYRSREADPSLAAGCSDDCLKSFVCMLLKSEILDNTQCNEITDSW